MTTMADLITKVEQRLSQVAGPSVQRYAEDRIAMYIQQAFDYLFEKYDWPQFMNWISVTLDGTLGIPTSNLSTMQYPLKNFRHICNVYRSTDDTPLARLPSNINPYKIQPCVLYYAPYNDATKVFQVWPHTATDTLYVQYKSKPDAFIANSIVDFDENILVYRAAYDYAEDDGSNPGMIAKLLGMYNEQLKTIVAETNDQPIPLNACSCVIPSNVWSCIC